MDGRCPGTEIRRNSTDRQYLDLRYQSTSKGRQKHHCHPPNRLGWTQEKIAEVVGLSRNRASEIVGNANFGKIDTLLSQGRDMDSIAKHYNIDLALAWALLLEGKTDQEKFKALGWGLRTWDEWKFNKCDERFGDDWPGRIPSLFNTCGA